MMANAMSTKPRKAIIGPVVTRLLSNRFLLNVSPTLASPVISQKPMMMSNRQIAMRMKLIFVNG